MGNYEADTVNVGDILTYYGKGGETCLFEVLRKNDWAFYILQGSIIPLNVLMSDRLGHDLVPSKNITFSRQSCERPSESQLHYYENSKAV